VRLLHLNNITYINQSWLVLGWAGMSPQYVTQPPRSTQPPTVIGMGNESRYWPKGCEAVWLESIGRYGLLQFVDKHAGGR